MELENIAMEIIAHSGEARSLTFEALDAYKRNDITKANDLLEKAESEITEAHKAQMGLLVAEANGEDVKVNVLLVHAQDHFMTSMLALDLAKSMISIFESKKGQL